MGFLRICEKHKKGHRGDKMKMLSSGGLSQNLRKLLGARLCFVQVFEYQNLQIDNTSFFSPTRLFEKNFSASDPHFQRKAVASVY